MTGVLVLRDGSRFEGRLFGAPTSIVGELVFNTSVVGYQEIATDPSYHRQIVVLTTPEIGNYGTSIDAQESQLAHAAGLVIRHMSPHALHRTSRQNLSDYLASIGVPCIAELDTRALTQRIRDQGPTTAWIGSSLVPESEIFAHIEAEPPMTGANLVPDVSTPKAITHGKGSMRVVLLDFGIKANTIRCLVERGCQVIQVPWNTSYDAICAHQPNGILLSNGPGDPDAVPRVRETVQELMDSFPTFGICLGFQIMALALGARTYKLPFGHRGGNHPVKDLATGKVVITSQNHGFAVDADSLPTTVSASHISLFDRSLEGFVLKDKPSFGVQFHPEAAPGPRDCANLFDEFVRLMGEASA